MGNIPFRQRVEQNGATTKTVSEQEKEKEKKRYKAGRKETERFLDAYWYKGAGRPRKGWKGH